LFKIAVGIWNIAPSEYWRLTPCEFWHIYNAKQPPEMIGGFTIDEYNTLLELIPDGE